MADINDFIASSNPTDADCTITSATTFEGFGVISVEEAPPASGEIRITWENTAPALDKQTIQVTATGVGRWGSVITRSTTQANVASQTTSGKSLAFPIYVTRKLLE